MRRSDIADEWKQVNAQDLLGQPTAGQGRDMNDASAGQRRELPTAKPDKEESDDWFNPRAQLRQWLNEAGAVFTCGFNQDASRAVFCDEISSNGQNGEGRLPSQPGRYKSVWTKDRIEATQARMNALSGKNRAGGVGRGAIAMDVPSSTPPPTGGQPPSGFAADVHQRHPPDPSSNYYPGHQHGQYESFHNRQQSPGQYPIPSQYPPQQPAYHPNQQHWQSPGQQHWQGAGPGNRSAASHHPSAHPGYGPMEQQHPQHTYMAGGAHPQSNGAWYPGPAPVKRHFEAAERAAHNLGFSHNDDVRVPNPHFEATQSTQKPVDVRHNERILQNQTQPKQDISHYGPSSALLGEQRPPGSPDNVPRVLHTTPKKLEHSKVQIPLPNNHHLDARGLDRMPVPQASAGSAFDVASIKTSLPQEEPPAPYGGYTSPLPMARLPSQNADNSNRSVNPSPSGNVRAPNPSDHNTRAAPSAGESNVAAGKLNGQSRHPPNRPAVPPPMPNYVMIDETGTHKEQLEEGNYVKPHLDATTVLTRSDFDGGFKIEADIVELGWEKKALKVV